MSDPKRQHYVPRTYLKQFSYDGAKDPHIHVLFKDTGGTGRAGIKNVAVENNFYTVNECDNKYEWEEYYSKEIEPEFGKWLKIIRQRCEPALVQDGTVILKPNEKESISECMIAQMFRGQTARKYSQDIYMKLLPEMLNGLRAELGPIDEKMDRVIESYRYEEKRKLILMDATIKEKSGSLKMLESMLFIFIKITGMRTFVTSDNPVMVLNRLTGDVTPFNNGLADVSSAVYFPISPKLLLWAVHKTPIINLAERKDCSLEVLNSDKGKGFIDTANQKQWEQCCHGVYSQTKEELEKIII